MKIIAHTLIRNEEKFIWYSVNSVINHVDKLLIWDTGSTDKTCEIVRTINSSKIEFKNLGRLTPKELTKARQRMIDESNGFDWIFILDGDEIWHDDSIIEIKKRIASADAKAVVVPNYMLIGDVFHYQEKKAGRYKISDRVGHYNIRLIKNENGIYLDGNYPNEAFMTKDGVKMQDLPNEKLLFIDNPYLHASFIKKTKYENGEEFPKDYYFPEVFFLDRPEIVKSPWETPNIYYKMQAFWQTPLKKIKRRVI